MKKKVLFAVTALSMLLLPGCLADTYDLTNKEQDIIAEYTAAVLLRNEKTYTQALITPTPTPTPQVTPSPVPTKAADSEPGSKRPSGSGNASETIDTISASLSEVFGLAGLEVEYSGYSVMDSFSDGSGSAYIVRPKDGNQLVKVDLKLVNTAGIVQEIDFGSLNMNYRLECKESKSVGPQITAADLLHLKAEIPANDSMDVYLIFEIGKDVASDGSKLTITRDKLTSVISLD